MRLKREVEGFKICRLLIIVFLIIILAANYVIAAENSLSEEQKKIQEELLKKISSDPSSLSYVDFLKDEAVAKDIVKNHLKELVIKKNRFSWFQNIHSSERENFFDNYYDEFASAYDGLTNEEKTDLFFGRDKENAALMDKKTKEKIYPKFLSAFKQLKLEEQAKYWYDKTSKGDLIIDNEYKNKIWQDLGENEADALLKSVGNRAFKNLYGKFPNGNSPELQSVSLKDKNKLVWDQNKITGEKGGYINFMRSQGQKQGYLTDDTIDARVTGVAYENGKFSEKILGGRTIEFSQGTAADGTFIGKDGEPVGGDKGLFWDYYRNDANGKLITVGNGKESIISFEYNDKGEALVKLDGNDYDNTLLRTKDVHGNNIFFGFNKDNIAHGQNGVMPDYEKPIIRFDKDGIMHATRGALNTVGYGTYKVSNNKEVALVGNFFNEPGAGPKGIGAEIAKTTGSKYIDAIIQSGKDVLDDSLKKLELAIQKTGDLDAVKTLQASFEKVQKVAPLAEDAKQVEDTVNNAISSLLGESVKTNYIVSAQTKAVEGLINDGIKTAASAAGYYIGAVSTIPGEAKARFLQEISNIGTKPIEATLQELSHPQYEQYAKNKESYLSIDVYKNPLAGLTSKGKDVTVPFIRVAIGGDGYIGADLTNFYKNIDVLTVNSKGTNGENVYVKDGNSLFTFDNGKTLLNNQILNPSNVYGQARYAVPINRIYNENAPNKVALKLGKDINGRNSVFTIDVDSNARIKKASQYVQGSSSDRRLINRITAAVTGTIYGGGMVVKNPPMDPNLYPGDSSGTSVSIEVSGERIYGTGIGRPGGLIERKVNEKASESSMPTNMPANMMSAVVVNTIDQKINEFGYSGVNFGMNAVNDLANKLNYNELNQLIPGYSNELKDYAYLWTHPEAFDRTMQALSQAGQIQKGVPLTLTMNDGMYLGGRKIQGTDSVVTRIIASQIVRQDIPSSTMTVEAAQAKQSQLGTPKQLYSLTQYESFARTGNTQALKQIMTRVKKDAKF